MMAHHGGDDLLPSTLLGAMQDRALTRAVAARPQQIWALLLEPRAVTGPAAQRVAAGDAQQGLLAHGRRGWDCVNGL